MNFLPLTKRATTGTFSSLLIPPQNGVVERAIHFSSGAGSASSLVRVQSTDVQCGSVATSDTPSRPKKLSGNGLKCNVTENRFPAFNLNHDEGSLPCTPELPTECGPEIFNCTSGDEALEHDTRQLIGHVLRNYTGVSKQQWKENKALSTMRRVVEDVIEKHRYAYNGMILKLGLEEQDDDMSFIMSVAKSLFSDGTTNWGRIASLVAFGTVVCQHLKEKGRDHCVDLVGVEISTYLLSDQREWLVKNNAWGGFVDFFRVTDPESTVRNTLIAFAGFAGIGATLALLIR